MTTTRVAHRYAKALMDLAREQGEIDVIVEDVRTVRGALHGSKELRRLLETPVIDERMKQKVLTALFADKVGKVMGRFLQLITSKGRACDLPSITDAFMGLLDNEHNVVTATITTASAIDASQQKQIEDRIASLSGKTVRATYTVDPAIIGGFRARFEDTMVDASVRHQLERLRLALIEGNQN
jgi:F-type H+-transporting ATPase subunit delta